MLESFHILLIEEGYGFAWYFLHAIQGYGAFPCVHAISGDEATAILCGERGYARLPHPYLIVLDLDMPAGEALRFLQEIRADATLRQSLVLGVASSCQTENAVTALDMGIIGCISKRVIDEDFGRLVALFSRYRFVAFPPDQR